ncbi:hypothetical protein HDF24_04515 [Mucilaginibacter sp. X4EP1]|jgi:hypothetical protein|uniref:hypothetical protein n=1 Tax=Mucilaginibacter sp. X4EP1 TaxID=2723092 RepID=UPI0021683EC0|nr:hypothetical protein [Mucilaginibacter sp. X4EP1]MCS3816254.1 uncharacterized short protein YbdD (DUF466 family) [Mucilaginibacter sp. X4EP1]
MDKIMEAQFVTDVETGEPLRVNLSMDYKEYVELAKKNHLPLTPTSTVQERNPLDWYSLTESTKSILTGLVALASTEHMKEMKKAHPNQDRIAELVALRDEAHQANRNTQNYKTMERMEELIAKYSPILLAEKKKIL